MSDHHSSHSSLAVCPSCGATHRVGIAFCPRCGRPLGAPPATFELHLLSGSVVLSRMPLPKATVTIGRAPDNTIPLTDPKVSRQHARLTWDGGAYLAEDVGSRGGTLLNGVPLRSPTRLNVGDLLALGDTVLRLGVAGQVDAVQAPYHTPPVYPQGAPPPTVPMHPAYPQQPPSAPPQSPQVYQQNAPPAYPQQPSQHQAQPAVPQKSRGRMGLFVAGGVGILTLACIGVLALTLFGPWRNAIGGLLPGAPTAPAAQELGQSSPTIAPEPTAAAEPLTLTVIEQNSIVVAPDGLPHADSNGISLTAPPDLLEEPGDLELAAGTAQGTLADELGRLFSIETPFYQVVAGQDGRGRAELSFPAAGPESRVAVVIDDEYVALLETPPTDGVIRVQAFVGPKTLPDPPPFGVAREGSLRYVVLGSKTGNAALPGSFNPFAVLLGGETAYAADGYRDCMGYTTLTSCRTNGKVYVMWRLAVPLKPADAEAIIASVETLMKAYTGKGFTAAQLSPSNTVSVIIDPSVTAAQYSSKNGIVYLPVDSAGKITSDEGRRELAHELFHWIQDEEYAMTFAAVSGPKTWWLEVAAENGVFLIDDGALEYNLTHYGQVSVDGVAFLGLQAAPYTWAWSEEARYVQAQLLKVNMCDSSACAISEKGFIAAINAGEYPLAGGDAQSKIRANLDDYARYLLGTAPERANTAIALGPVVRSGDSYGDTIGVHRTSKSEFTLEKSSYPPQMVEKTPKDRAAEVVIEARIDQDGVYPLRIGSGDRLPPSWPVMLKIEPGAEFYYRLGDDPVIHHPGDKELILGPIHKTMGYPAVRLVALGRGQASTFKATLQVVDLQGDWLLLPGAVSSNSIVCTSTDEDASSSDSSDIRQFATLIAMSLGPQGSYAFTSPNELEYTLDGGVSLDETLGEGAALDVSALIGPDNIQGMQRVVWPPPTNGANPAPLALLLLPLGLVTWHSRHRMARLALVLLAGLFLAGCVGIEIYGSLDTRYNLTKLEYVGKGDVMGEPLWRISQGTAGMDVDLTISVTPAAIDENDTPETSTSTCTGRIEHDLVVEIYKEGVVTPPEESGE